MKEIIGVEEFKSISLDILVVINSYCEENNIKYSLGLGTLLGAIRHKGFIPWDDDIDVYLLREDYNRLLTTFPEVYDNVSIASLGRSNEWGRAYAKAYDVRTVEIENSTDDTHIGVGIDLFPIDYAPDSDDEWQKYNKKRMFLQNVFSMKFIRVSKKRSLIKNICVALAHLVLLPFSFRFIAKQIDTYAQKYNGRKTSRLYENCMGVRGKHPFDIGDFRETFPVPFENKEFQAMVGYDHYLTSFYGDYMRLPPKEKQVSHHSFIAYWK